MKSIIVKIVTQVKRAVSQVQKYKRRAKQRRINQANTLIRACEITFNDESATKIQRIIEIMEKLYGKADRAKMRLQNELRLLRRRALELEK